MNVPAQTPNDSNPADDSQSEGVITRARPPTNTEELVQLTPLSEGTPAKIRSPSLPHSTGIVREMHTPLEPPPTNELMGTTDQAHSKSHAPNDRSPLLDNDDRVHLHSQLLGRGTDNPNGPQSRLQQRTDHLPPPYEMMTRKLREGVNLDEMALFYGLDKKALTTVAAQQKDTRQKRLAVTELTKLKCIRTYLTAKRAKILCSGESFVVPIVRIPSRILSTEKGRLAELESKGKKRARNFTN